MAEEEEETFELSELSNSIRQVSESAIAKIEHLEAENRQGFRAVLSLRDELLQCKTDKAQDAQKYAKTLTEILGYVKPHLPAGITNAVTFDLELHKVSEWVRVTVNILAKDSEKWRFIETNKIEGVIELAKLGKLYSEFTMDMYQELKRFMSMIHPNITYHEHDGIFHYVKDRYPMAIYQRNLGLLKSFEEKTR